MHGTEQNCGTSDFQEITNWARLCGYHIFVLYSTVLLRVLCIKSPHGVLKLLRARYSQSINKQYNYVQAGL
jgi:hypothetical protein